MPRSRIWTGSKAAYPGLLGGLSFTPYAPNPPAPYPEELGPYNGLSNTRDGTIFLMTVLDFYRRSADHETDGETKFMLTLFQRDRARDCVEGTLPRCRISASI